MDRRIKIIALAVALAALIIGLGMVLNRSGGKQDANTGAGTVDTAGTETVSPDGTDADQTAASEPAETNPAAEPAGTQETEPEAQAPADDTGTNAPGSGGSGGNGNTDSNAKKPGSSDANTDTSVQEGSDSSAIEQDIAEGSMPILELETVESDTLEEGGQPPVESSGSTEDEENETSMMTDF